MGLILLFSGLVQSVLAVLLSRPSLLKRQTLRRALSAVLLFSGLIGLSFGVRVLLASEIAGPDGSAPTPWVENQLDEQGALLGLVREGELVILAPATSAGATARLTGISMVESVGPESKEIDLQPYEGMSLVVRGHDGGGWIYEAEIVDQGGPLLTALVQEVYRSTP